MKTDLLKDSDPSSVGLDASRLELVQDLLEEHIRERKYEGCQIAVARHGSLVLNKTYGICPDISKRGAPQDYTLFCIRSMTKTFTAAVIWSLVEEGRLTFFDRVVDHIPEFGALGDGKDAVTIFQLLTHQAGFPHADVTKEAWADHRRLRKEVCLFPLEWTPGSKVFYHSYNAQWVLAAIIESVTGADFRDVVRERIVKPLRIGRDFYMGAPDSEHERIAREHSPVGRNGGGIAFHAAENTPEWYHAGHPHGGGIATARGVVTFFQLLALGGAVCGQRVFSSRLIEYVARNHTGDRLDERLHQEQDPGEPLTVANFGLGIKVRGEAPGMHVCGSLAGPRTVFHGGGVNSIAWSDPDKGVSFAYVSNAYVPRSWMAREMERMSNIVHSAVL
ncbi:serine hydrolase domain-containing protein [Bradyrhizobium elkanii]|uniref:serine hydrolase domain-containing protein n=1 Tax=Bradyrhizobium elkanii TaxID=29448 RepID=UPI00155ACE6A|nr:serine hydrolase domain-containing protein [Bradyrhizobium elkanii]MCP1927773.1 CubicO group peptidase (beta-lactamase class C family) [Bradyrhizobium elkanii]MCS3581618.1 CubicO group peptidase (beta-lactamase class C family) [Bradyrhizobium elkanii]MCS3724492.1 CubicO group peptidase (beta-lactamase class C family) [Bradyrhizobium elkanii]MCS4008904.1 CubicO group peptidase (beta-lactamase class C family) [Bradyrhizobium elkanii USDA 61]